ncbi:hypothetical protein M1116_03545 [Patescibacteria group bacterium]|nr:hypothetical protein [Patescibacteria group bacterium]
MNTRNPRHVVVLVVTILALVASTVLAACGGIQGAQAVRDGKIFDWVSNWEPRPNGYDVIWFRFDPVAGYCTNNQDTKELAEYYALNNVYVLSHYETINFGASDGSFLGSGCPNDVQNGSGNNPVYRLTCIEVANPKDPANANIRNPGCEKVGDSYRQKIDK